jgi:hypothetical protein
MKTYQSGVGKLLYLMHWFHLEAWNAVHELKRFMSKASLAHLKAMYHVMTYMLGTPNCGKIFQPFGRYCEGFKFCINLVLENCYIWRIGLIWKHGKQCGS